MKALQIIKYGGNDVLEVVKDALPPELDLGQAMVQNHAASINAIDWKIRAGFFKKMVDLPMPITLGSDFAGTITKISGEPEGFEIGDEVYGQAIVMNGSSGSMAEQIAVNLKNIARKPQTTSFVEASALPLVGVSALQALEEHIKLKQGQKILVQGGAGGIGHIAIQYAAALGAHVATTVSADDMDFVKSLGADEVIDYRKEKFNVKLRNYDAVFDTVGGEAAIKSFEVLKKGGILVSMLGKPDEELAKKYDVTVIGQNTKTDTKHLERLAELVDFGKIKVNIDKVFPLDKAREAFEYQENVHPKGKVVLEMDNQQ